MIKQVENIQEKITKLINFLMKRELLIPYILLLVIMIDISLTQQQIFAMDEAGVIPAIMQPFFMIIFFVVLPIKSYTWFLIYNLIIVFFTYYAYKYGTDHNRLFLKLIWTSVFLTYFVNLMVRFEEFSFFWDYYMILYYPLFLISLNGFDVFFQRNKAQIKNAWYYLKIPVIYIGVVFIIALLSQTSVLSYAASARIGVSGWYVSSNSIGHLLTATFPILLYYFINNLKNKWLWLAIILSIFAQFAIGTKAPVFGMGITLLIFLGVLLVEKFYHKRVILRQMLVVISLLLVVVVAFNFSPLKHNLEISGGIGEIDLASGRYDFLKQRASDQASLFEDFSKYLLILNGNNDYGVTLIEKDYYDIFYNNGIVGSFVFLIVVGYYIKKAFLNYFRNWRNHLNLKTASFVIPFFLLVGIAYYAGHIFVGSYIAIYSAFLIVLFYFRSFANE